MTTKAALLLSVALVGGAYATPGKAAFYWEGLGPFVQSDGQGSTTVVVNTTRTGTKIGTPPQK